MHVEPRDKFPEHVEVGMQFEGKGEESGETMVYTVTDIADDKVVVDGNHPLAGQTLHMECTVARRSRGERRRDDPRPRARGARPPSTESSRLRSVCLSLPFDVILTAFECFVSGTLVPLLTFSSRQCVTTAFES